MGSQRTDYAQWATLILVCMWSGYTITMEPGLDMSMIERARYFWADQYWKWLMIPAVFAWLSYIYFRHKDK